VRREEVACMPVSAGGGEVPSLKPPRTTCRGKELRHMTRGLLEPMVEMPALGRALARVGRVPKKGGSYRHFTRQTLTLSPKPDPDSKLYH